MSSIALAHSTEKLDGFSPVGGVCQDIIADCVRRWAEGSKLSDSDRRIVDDALTFNRLEMIQVLFRDEEAGHVR